MQARSRVAECVRNLPCKRLRRLHLLSTLSLVALALNGTNLQAQVYFTGPYGPGGTWNLYEHRGFLGSDRIPGAVAANSWPQAHQDAISRVEPFSGMNAQGHLIALSGPTAQQENDFISAHIATEPGGAWIGLTDDEAFGGGEAGNNGMSGFGNPPGDGIGWKWTSGEVFDYSNWDNTNPNADYDIASISENTGHWTASSTAPRSYVIEYETRSPTPIDLPPTPLPAFLPGLPARAGAFGIREVANNGPIDPPGSVGGSVSGAIRSLESIAPDAVVRDYYAPVIDFQSEFFGSSNGPNRPFEVLQRGDVSADQLDDFVMVAHAQIHIPEGQGGDWTFAVSSDDGFELYIRGFPVRAFAECTSYSVWISEVSKRSNIQRGRLIARIRYTATGHTRFRTGVLRESTTLIGPIVCCSGPQDAVRQLICIGWRTRPKRARSNSHRYRRFSVHQPAARSQ